MHARKACKVLGFSPPSTEAWAHMYGSVTLMVICLLDTSMLFVHGRSHMNKDAPLRGKEDMPSPKHYTVSFS